MRRKTLVTVVLLLALSALALPVSAAPPHDPFVGTWEAIDIDGSNLTMRITGNPRSRYHISQNDDWATVCGGIPARARGWSVANGHVLTGELAWYCMSRPPYHAVTYPHTITYDPVTDTLSEEIWRQGELLVITWYRTGPRSPFVGVWEATDVDESHMTFAIRGGSVGRYRMHYYDDWATVCGGIPARALGWGVADGHVLTGELELYCMSRPPYHALTYTPTLTYDPVADTLSEEIWWQGELHVITWYRQQ